jgi:hypothetical protein
MAGQEKVGLARPKIEHALVGIAPSFTRTCRRPSLRAHRGSKRRAITNNPQNMENNVIHVRSTNYARPGALADRCYAAIRAHARTCSRAKNRESSDGKCADMHHGEKQKR